MTKDKDDTVVELYPLDKLSDYEKLVLEIQSLPTYLSHAYWLDHVQDSELEMLMRPVVRHLLKCLKENNTDTGE